ncbi:lytic transglycosylase domain-containing protein [Paraburkholderia sp. A2WS-5]|uniref:lytic transglycosylase domain-containing protein n=1 Tax=Paraburkholderia sp. A2WS-5 TaxID=3028372 RepID=UPI003B7ABF2C
MMPLALFLTLAQQCAPAVAPATMAAVVRVESAFNPWAIGVVHGRLARQPRNFGEAHATVRALEAAGWNYSAGLAQVNRSNWARLNLTPDTVFDPCSNLAAGAAILKECFTRAQRTRARRQDALRAALSCYASGDFSAGYRTGYVQRVVANAANAAGALEAGPPVETAVGPGAVTGIVSGIVPGVASGVVPAVEPDTPPIPVIAVDPERAPVITPQPDPSSSHRAGSRTDRLENPAGEAARDSAVVF